MKPRHGLTHPLWLGALALLVLNDHWLKGSALLPGWLTGKLSDAAGMIVAPLLVAAILRLSSKRAFLLAHVAVGAVFAAIKLVPDAARAFEALTALTPFPWTIVVDPTDVIVALPMLFVSYAVLGRAMQEERRLLGGRALEAALLGASALACMATSPPPCDDCAPQPAPAPFEEAALVLANTTGTDRLVRVRELESTVLVDCATMLSDPSGTLSRELFAPAQTWLLQPGRALPLRSTGPCSVYLVDAQGLEPMLIAWNESAFPNTRLRTDANPTATTISMRDVGGRLELDPHPAVFEAPLLEPPPPAQGCEVPADTVGIDWSEPPNGEYQIVSIATSPDGCHMIELSSDQFVVCLPMATLPFSEGETLGIYSWSALGQFPENASTANASGIVLKGMTSTIWAVRGNVLARPNDSGLYDSERDFSASVEARTGCGLHHDECGDAVQPLDVTVLGAGVDGVVSGSAGAALVLGSGATLFVVRSQAMPIVDTECSPFATGDQYFESVLVMPTQGSQP